MRRLVLLAGVVVVVLLQPSPAVAAWQAYGQDRVSATATRVEKATAPTVAPAGSTAILTWAQVTLETGQPATGYIVVRDVAAQRTEVCRTSGALTCTDSAPVAGRQTYRVYALFGPWTGPVSGGTTYTPDVDPPTTTATPDGSGWIATSPARVTLTATDTGSGVASVSYRIDSGGWTSVNGAVSAFDVHGEGITTITYRATDNVGNVEADRTLVLRIDSRAPAAPTGLSIASDSGASATDRITNVAANRVVGAGEPGSTVEIRRGSTVVATGTVSAAGTLDVPVTLVSGAQTLAVRLVDQAGHVSPSGSLLVTLDQAAPVVTPRPPNLQNENKWSRVCTEQGLPAGLCGTVSDASEITQVSYEVRVTDLTPPLCWSGNRWSTCGYRPATGLSPWSVPLPWDDLLDGHYEVRIRATDVAGNVNASTAATYAFTVS